MHVNQAFASSCEHDAALLEGAIRCLTILMARTATNDPKPGFRHLLSALTEALVDMRPDLDPDVRTESPGSIPQSFQPLLDMVKA